MFEYVVNFVKGKNIAQASYNAKLRELFEAERKTGELATEQQIAEMVKLGAAEGVDAKQVYADLAEVRNFIITTEQYATEMERARKAVKAVRGVIAAAAHLRAERARAAAIIQAADDLLMEQKQLAGHSNRECVLPLINEIDTLILRNPNLFTAADRPAYDESVFRKFEAEKQAVLKERKKQNKGVVRKFQA